jgi:hypothetical protein
MCRPYRVLNRHHALSGRNPAFVEPSQLLGYFPVPDFDGRV